MTRLVSDEIPTDPGISSARAKAERILAETRAAREKLFGAPTPLERAVQSLTLDTVEVRAVGSVNGFHEVCVGVAGCEGLGSSRSQQRALAYALQALADDLIAASGAEEL